VNAVFILWLRQLNRYSRSRARMIGSPGQPILFLLALGFGLGPTFARAGRGDYVQFLARGIVTMPPCAHPLAEFGPALVACRGRPRNRACSRTWGAPSSFSPRPARVTRSPSSLTGDMPHIAGSCVFIN
jgi:hypothetical protein